MSARSPFQCALTACRWWQAVMFALLAGDLAILAWLSWLGVINVLLSGVIGFLLLWQLGPYLHIPGQLLAQRKEQWLLLQDGEEVPVNLSYSLSLLGWRLLFTTQHQVIPVWLAGLSVAERHQLALRLARS